MTSTNWNVRKGVECGSQWAWKGRGRIRHHRSRGDGRYATGKKYRSLLVSKRRWKIRGVHAFRVLESGKMMFWKISFVGFCLPFECPDIPPPPHAVVEYNALHSPLRHPRPKRHRSFIKASVPPYPWMLGTVVCYRLCFFLSRLVSFPKMSVSRLAASLDDSNSNNNNKEKNENVRKIRDILEHRWIRIRYWIRTFAYNTISL